MNSKEAYKAFCEKEKSIPLFLTYKWLENFAPSWDVVIHENGEGIAGAFPYIIFKKKGFTIIDLPLLTVYGGPWIKYPDNTQKYTNRLTYEKEVMNQIIQRIPPFDYFNQKFHPGIQNWIPFYWKGYSQSTKYTYIIDCLKDKDLIFNNFSDNIRNKIRKAEKSITVSSSNDIEILLRLKDKASQERGLNLNVKDELIKKMFDFCIRENCGELLIGISGNDIHCASLFVWDKKTCYYLYGVSNPQFQTSGGMSILLWNAIQRYSNTVDQFNFEGSMLEGVERFFRGFGGKLIPYHHIQKTNSKLLKTLYFVKDFLK